MKKYQTFFNKWYGYRKDYPGTLKGYLKEICRRYFFHIYVYKNKDNISYISKSITFFWYTPFAIKFQTVLSKGIFWNGRISFSIIKLNWQIGIDIKRNTA